MTAAYLVLVLIAFAVMQFLMGGTRLLFSLPADGLLGAAAVLSLVSLRRAKPAPDSACLLALLIFAGSLFARALGSPVAYLAWPDLFSIAGAAVVYLLTACYLTDPGRRLWLVAGLMGLALVQLVVGAIQFSRGDGYMLFHWEDTIFDFIRSSDYAGRASGLYICPNHLAGFLEVVGSLMLAIAFWGRLPLWGKLLSGYCALICFFGLLLTGSRGGFLSTAAALGVLGVLSLVRARATAPENFGRVFLAALFVAVLLAAGATAVAWKSDLLRKRSARMFQSADRKLLWGAALQEFKANPLLGTGSGTYLFYGRRFRDPSIQRDPVHVHNDYLELLGEYGLLGAGGFLLFLAAHLRAGFKNFRALLASGKGVPLAGLVSSNAAALNLGALAALASYLVHSVFDFNLHIPANALLMGFICGVLANSGRGAERRSPHPSGIQPVPRVERTSWRTYLPRLALGGLGLFLLVGGLPKLPGEYQAEKARVALRDEQYLEAILFAQRGLKQEQRNPDLFYYLGEARLSQSQQTANPLVARSFVSAAVEPLEAGRRLFPQDVRLLLRLGLTFTLLGRFPEAEQVIEQALQWDPNSGRVHAYQAFCLQKQGRLKEAAAAYRHALELLPDARIAVGAEQVQREEIELHRVN